MGDDAVILEGVDGAEAAASLYSTVHGAGRLFGRKEAKRRFSRAEMDEWLGRRGVQLLGGDLDESPMAYRRLPDVLAYHEASVRVLHKLLSVCRRDGGRRRIRSLEGLKRDGRIAGFSSKPAACLRVAAIPRKRSFAMSHSSLFLFAAVYLAAIATPGPGIAALVARVLANGLKGVVPFILGYVIGDWIWLVFAASGLQVIAKNFAPLFMVVKYAGAALI